MDFSPGIVQVYVTSAIIRSLTRIVIATAGAVIVLYGVGAAVLRQPIIGRAPFLPRTRADAAQLRRHLSFLTTDVRPRDFRHIENLDRAADYIKREFAKNNCKVSEQTYETMSRTFRNVVCALGPADPSRLLLIVGAHYDAFSMIGNLPGADDNASGTAGVIELSRILGHEALKNPVQLVAFTNEEPPFFARHEMGSAIHADSLLESDRKVRAMICLEMIGYFTGEERYDSPVLGWFYPSRGNFIAIAGGWDDRTLTRDVKRAMRSVDGLNVLSFTGPRKMADASDQRNYWERGFTAVMITDTAYLRNPNYHASGDTADTLDYRQMALVVDGVANAVITLDRD